MTYLYDLLAALAVIANGIPVAMFALSLGFSLRPAAFAFFIGAIGLGSLGIAAPISMQGETIALLGVLGKNRSERVSISLLSEIIMIILGVFGLLQTVINFIGPTIFHSMLAGVGLFLAKVGLIDMGKKDLRIGLTTIISATAIFVASGNLIYTILGSVACGLLATIKYPFVSALQEAKELSAAGNFEVADLDTIKRIPISFKSPNVIRGALAMSMLTIGGNIAYGSITGQLANSPVNVDHLSVVSAAADMASALFGGPPIESIISATGIAPHPVFAAVLMMVLFGVLMFSGVLMKLAKFIPVGAIAGFYFVLGALVTFPPNIKDALAANGNPVVVGVTMVVTATFDPFLGLVAGYLTKTLFTLLGTS